MKNGKRALWRLLRILAAYLIIYGVRELVRCSNGFTLPAWMVPVIAAVLNAVAKFVRDEWRIDIRL